MWIILKPHTNPNTQGQSQALCAVPHAVWGYDLLQLLLAESLGSVTKWYLCEDLPSAFSIGPCPVPEYTPMLPRTHRPERPRESKPLWCSHCLFWSLSWHHYFCRCQLFGSLWFEKQKVSVVCRKSLYVPMATLSSSLLSLSSFMPHR